MSVEGGIRDNFMRWFRGPLVWSP